MKIGKWSLSAGGNNAVPPDGWPEGQAPSTINDCARENMAAIRVAFADVQFFDQDFTPTYINATSFSVIGNQTSAIHAGRRLKVFDAGNVLYATVQTASFSVVTTIHVNADSGNLTSSLSSFALAILSVNNSSIPQNQSISAAAINIAGALSVEGAVVLKTTLNVSATVIAAQVAKAWCFFEQSATSGEALKIRAGFNVAAVSFTAGGSDGHVYRITFTNAMADANYGYHINLYGLTAAKIPLPSSISHTAATLAFRSISAGSSSGITADYGMVSVFR